MSRRKLFIHSEAIVDTSDIGPGTSIWAFAHVCKNAVVGAHCNIGEGCYIEGGSFIGDNVTVKNGAMIWEGVKIANDAFIGPGVVFTNDYRPRSARFELVREKYQTKKWLTHTNVARGASIGANATVHCGVSIGEFAMIGAGAMVTSDVPPYTLVFGNPARVRGHVCACGEKLIFRRSPATCGACGRKFRKTNKGVAPVG